MIDPGRRPRRGTVASSVAIIAVGALVVLPVAAVALRAVRPDGAWGIDALTRILSNGRTWRLFGVTVAQALASCLLTLIVGLPVAWVFARYRFPGRGILRVAVTVPFVLPAVVVGAALAAMLGPNGLIDARGTWYAVLAAHLAFNLAVVVRIVSVAVAGVPANLPA
ncbi:MAG: hypothetical protein ACKOYM_07010, partial [Actinomycetes bacterium]